jgi:hypothetical protein
MFVCSLHSNWITRTVGEAEGGPPPRTPMPLRAQKLCARPQPAQLTGGVQCPPASDSLLVGKAACAAITASGLDAGGAGVAGAGAA